MNMKNFTRRSFIQHALTLSAGAPLALSIGGNGLMAAGLPRARRTDAKVAIVSCRGYGAELGPALDKCLDLLGGLGHQLMPFRIIQEQ